MNACLFDGLKRVRLDLSLGVQLIADHEDLGIGLVVALRLWQPVLLETLGETMRT